MDSTPTFSRTLSHHCTDGICHCDWRLSISDCEEAGPMRVVYLANIVLSIIVVLVGAVLLFRKLVLQKLTLFDFKSSKGFLRPRPVEAMLFFLVVFNILRLVSSAVLLADVAPDNMILRSFLFEFPWQFGYCAFALYLVGIVQTLADSHREITAGWLPSPTFVDIFGLWICLSPFVLNNTTALAAGGVAASNLFAAEILSRILYVLWFIHCGTVSFVVVYAGLRLVNILNSHLNKFGTSGARYTSVKTGTFRIQVVVSIISSCLMSYASFMFIYGILRDSVMANTTGSVILGVIWTLLGALATVFVEIVIIVNPKIKNPGLGMKFTGADKLSISDMEKQSIDEEADVKQGNTSQPDYEAHEDGYYLRTLKAETKTSMADHDSLTLVAEKTSQIELMRGDGKA